MPLDCSNIQRLKRRSARFYFPFYYLLNFWHYLEYLKQPGWIRILLIPNAHTLDLCYHFKLYFKFYKLLIESKKSHCSLIYWLESDCSTGADLADHTSGKKIHHLSDIVCWWGPCSYWCQWTPKEVPRCYLNDGPTDRYDGEISVD